MAIEDLRLTTCNTDGFVQRWAVLVDSARGSHRRILNLQLTMGVSVAS